ncbi:hypothetical protein FLL45_17125 [Aliikangiella marina]|uniref:Chalcone isomerase domain-containing protein n=1 Tax=Aliikangiella marina TaxID=1712262 RepID=A0A545T7G9_9GAMM|nr:chalcone isomerase family protein [Aliikangiella marina]TQV73169.1 hypothetical protein FLL45_17125 [Aliikangiella marina]
MNSQNSILTVILKWSSLALLVGYSVTFSSHATASAEMPKDLKLVGESNLSVWWWDIYDAQLFTESGRYQTEELPLLLSITYNRDIDSADLIDETDSQWERFKIDEKQRKAWVEQLTGLWPDVRKDDNISFHIDKLGNCHFYFNGEFIGTVSDPNFSTSFSAIWLAENSAYPKMTQRLTGRNSNKK